jgi:hypothetical protein
MPKIKKIVDAEVTPVAEEVKEQPQQPIFNMDSVAEMVMVGRYKDGKKFVVRVNLNDELMAKAYLDYGIRYFDLVLDKDILDTLRN